jgi:hypothetical protein
VLYNREKFITQSYIIAAQDGPGWADGGNAVVQCGGDCGAVRGEAVGGDLERRACRSMAQAHYPSVSKGKTS